MKVHIFRKLGCEREANDKNDPEWWSSEESKLLYSGLNLSLWKYHCGEERFQEWGEGRHKESKDTVRQGPWESEACSGIVMAKQTLKDMITGPVASLLARNQLNFHSGRRLSSKMTVEDGFPPPSRLSQTTLLASLLYFSLWLVCLESYFRSSQSFSITILGIALCIPSWLNRNVLLLHPVTDGGRTEIYSQAWGKALGVLSKRGERLYKLGIKVMMEKPQRQLSWANRHSQTLDQVLKKLHGTILGPMHACDSLVCLWGS